MRAGCSRFEPGASCTAGPTASTSLRDYTGWTRFVGRARRQRPPETSRRRCAPSPVRAFVHASSASPRRHRSPTRRGSRPPRASIIERAKSRQFPERTSSVWIGLRGPIPSRRAYRHRSTGPFMQYRSAGERGEEDGLVVAALRESKRSAGHGSARAAMQRPPPLSRDRNRVKEARQAGQRRVKYAAQILRRQVAGRARGFRHPRAIVSPPEGKVRRAIATYCAARASRWCRARGGDLVSLQARRPLATVVRPVRVAGASDPVAGSCWSR